MVPTEISRSPTEARATRKKRGSRAGARSRVAIGFAAALLLAGCGGGSKPKAEAPQKPVFFGAVVSPDRDAGVIARNVLAAGGDAADAAVALGFALAVTLPSRAGLGGGGACVAYDRAPKGPGGGKPEAILFLPREPASGGGGDRPAAVPMLARGLFLLHARYGRLPMAQLLGQAQAMAEFGVRVSPALANDLAAAAGPLLADPGARAIFASPSGGPLAAGETMQQRDLGATLSLLRLNGISAWTSGPFASRFALATSAAGGGLSAADLGGAAPTIAEPIVLRAGNNRVAFLPPPADGGLGAAAAFRDLWREPADVGGAGARAQSIAALWRAGRGDARSLLAEKSLPNEQLPPLPASTTFATLDANGDAVACAVTMNNLFGTGRVAPGTGVLLARAPKSGPAPLLAAAIAWNNNLHAFRAAVGGSGQNGAALAVASAMANTLREKTPMPSAVPAPGRAQVIACSKWLPGNAASCGAASDPRSQGAYAFGGT